MKQRLPLLALLLCGLAWQSLHAQCSSLYTTPEFPVATHPSDGHTQSWGANIFTPAQWGGAATVTGIQIYVDNSYGPTTYAAQTVWLRHTAVSSYPNATYPGTAGFTQCFTGSYSFPMSGLYTIAFNASPFAYNGSQNVEVLFENRSNVYRANEPWFRRTTSYGAGVYRSKWNGNFGFGGFPGSGSDGSAVRLTYTLSLSAQGAGGCGAILPVDFPSFQAVPMGGEVACSWEIAAGQALGEVVLERSAGDADFQPVATFAAGEGPYSHLDDAPHAGLNLYRLRSIDPMGDTHLSAMVLVDMAGAGRLHLYAHAGADGLDVLLDSPARQAGTLTLRDLQGRVAATLPATLEAGRNHMALPMAAFPHALWLLEWQGEAGTRSAIKALW